MTSSARRDGICNIASSHINSTAARVLLLRQCFALCAVLASQVMQGCELASWRVDTWINKPAGAVYGCFLLVTSMLRTSCGCLEAAARCATAKKNSASQTRWDDMAPAVKARDCALSRMPAHLPILCDAISAE